MQSPHEFVAAVVDLATDTGKRAALGAAAQSAGQAFAVSELVPRYEREILDRYLA